MSAIDDVLRRATEAATWRLSGTGRSILSTTIDAEVGEVTRVVFMPPNTSAHAVRLLAEDAEVLALLPQLAEMVRVARVGLEAQKNGCDCPCYCTSGSALAAVLTAMEKAANPKEGEGKANG